jgi:hypothetical protein
MQPTSTYVDAMRHKPPESVLYTRTEAPITLPAQRKKTCRSRAIDFCAKRYLYVRDPHRQIDGLESFTLATHQSHIGLKSLYCMCNHL